MEIPSSTVWLVDSYAVAQDCSPGLEIPSQSGSAVAVSVQEVETGRTEKFLLTSAHLVKRYQQNGTGIGPTLKKVLCRKPNSGFVEWDPEDGWPDEVNNGIWVADVVDLYERPDGAWTEDDCRPEKDWVLLSY